MLNKLLKNTIFLTIGVSIVVFCVILVFTNIFYSLDKSISDRLHKEFVGSKLLVSDRIVVVGIDEQTLEALGRFPFSRDMYIPVIENLNNAWAIVIGFDVIFADESQKEIDKAFAKSIKKAENIILGGPLTSKQWRVFYEKPIDILDDASMWWWSFNAEVDHWNSKVYSIGAFTTIRNQRYKHFSIEVLKWYYSQLIGQNYIDFHKEDEHFYYITPTRKLPYMDYDSKKIAINYVSDARIASESFINVYKNTFSEWFFKDKIVIIGATADGIKDIFFTPEGIKYWVYTHANMINTELTKGYKIYFNKNAELLLIFFLIILSVYFNISRSWKGLALSNIWVISIFLVLISVIIMWLNLTLNHPAQFAFALIITLTVSNIIKSFTEDKNKTKLSKALWEYVSKDIAKEILHWWGELNLDWQRKDLSIFFSDIKWFTTISEKLDPEELVAFLREYLGAMSNVIMDQRGFIDKYEWDAIMAMWGVFGFSETSTYDNCIAALDQQKKLAQLNKQWKIRFWEELKVRMGLHTGEAIVWNIWATGRKMEFTALGDSVNLASRLEGVNKLYWTYICVSEDVYHSQENTFEFRYLDKIRVQWKTIPIGIYEMICKKWELTQEMKENLWKFDEAIKFYKLREFKKAAIIFEVLVRNWDAPSKTYVERCWIYIKDAPDPDWDWVWNMQTK